MTVTLLNVKENLTINPSIVRKILTIDSNYVERHGVNDPAARDEACSSFRPSAVNRATNVVETVQNK